MDDQLVTLSKIFTDRIFRIPDYQRGYAWTEKQLKDFWSDVQQLEPRTNHYTGVLTLEDVSPDIYKTWEDDLWIIEAKNFKPYFVVDGQQRLTTAIILIQVILETLGDGEKINFTSRADVQKRYIFDSKDGGGISRSYIFGYEKDNPSYEFLKTKVFGERSSSSQSQETIYTQNLERAKTFFESRVGELSVEEVEVLYRKITQQLLFNTFTITQDVEVCVAFETMNNRGKPLSYLELLKNRLIYLSLKFDVDDYEKSKLRSTINDCWKSIYHNLGRNKDKPLDDDHFLLTHYLTYFGTDVLREDAESATSESMYTSYRRLSRVNYAADLLEKRFIARNIGDEIPGERRVTVEKINRYVSSLQDSVQTWYKMWNPRYSDFSPEVNVWLDKFSRIRIGGVDTLLLVCLQTERSTTKQIELLKSVERCIFLTELGYGYSPLGGKFVDQFLRLAIAIGAGKSTVEKVTREVRDMATEVANDPHFIEGLINEYAVQGFYNWEGLRYFLYEYNLSLQNKARTERSKLFWPEFTEPPKDFLTVEHIYPRRARAPNWGEAFSSLPQKRRDALRESLGNLLPLSHAKNASLSNRSFSDKKSSPKDNTVGFVYGCYAENEVAKESDWTPDSILKRGLKMLAFLEKRWDLKIGTDADKARMLGLDFLWDGPSSESQIADAPGKEAQ